MYDGQHNAVILFLLFSVRDVYVVLSTVRKLDEIGDKRTTQLQMLHALHKQTIKTLRLIRAEMAGSLIVLVEGCQMDRASVLVVLAGWEVEKGRFLLPVPLNLIETTNSLKIGMVVIQCGIMQHLRLHLRKWNQQ